MKKYYGIENYGTSEKHSRQFGNQSAYEGHTQNNMTNGQRKNAIENVLESGGKTAKGAQMQGKEVNSPNQ